MLHKKQLLKCKKKIALLTADPKFSMEVQLFFFLIVDRALKDLPVHFLMILVEIQIGLIFGTSSLNLGRDVKSLWLEIQP